MTDIIRMMFLFLGGIVFASCIDIVSVEFQESNPQKLVIQASVTYGNPNLIQVDLGRTADTEAYFNATKIKNAEIYLFDSLGNKLVIPEKINGLYELGWINTPSFAITLGGLYYLEIHLSEGGIYRSEKERLLRVPKPSALQIGVESRQVLNTGEEIVEQDFLQVLIDTPIQHPNENEKAYLRWTMEGVFKFRELTPPTTPPDPKTCFVYEPLERSRVHIFNGFEANSQELLSYMIFEQSLNWHFATGYYLTVYQYSLTEGAYEYWKKVSESTFRNGSLFESPPGKIPSNLYNIENPEEEVLGYFSLTQVDTIRRLIKPEEVKNPRQYCAPFIGDDNYATAPDFCRDCLLWTNSSLEKPNYWIE